MKRIAIALLALFITAPASAQDWERVFSTIEDAEGGYKVLLLDPSEPRTSTDRYKLVSLEDLLRGAVTFPDRARRYIALSEHDPFTPASFAASDFTRSVEGVLTGIRMPPPDPDSFPVVWIGMAIPVDRSPPTYFSIGQAPGINAVGAIQQQAGTVTLDGEEYAVWIALTTAAHAVADYVFFDADAQVP